MKQKTIEYMRSFLTGDPLQKEDLEKYDVPAMQKFNAPFLWQLRDHGSDLMFLDRGHMGWWLDTEAGRMQLMRDSNAPFNSVFFSRGGGFSYYDGKDDRLWLCSEDCANAIFTNMWGDEIKSLKQTHPVEFEMKDEPLGLVAPPYYHECEEFAKSIGDESLTICVNRLRSWTRQAVDHKIVLAPDFSDHSLVFKECVNGKFGIVGGIVYNKYAEIGKRWTINT